MAVVLVAVLVAGTGLRFSDDLLVRSPVLDARENLAWSERIAEGAVPQEPMYRALLYPWLLSFFTGSGDALPQVAMCIGLLSHLLNALLVGLLAREVWPRADAAGWTGGVLYAAYPVGLYFSAQALDITPGMTLFLGGSLAMMRVLRARASLGLFVCLLGGLLGGLAVAVRPNFLPAVLLFPLIPVLSACLAARADAAPPAGLRRGLTGALLTGGALAFTLGLQGYVNWRLSGEFRVLPWQGSYNLYAANREGANGKFYKQRVSFDAVPAGMNTTRMESEYLYRSDAGSDAPVSVGAMNAFWKERLKEELASDPVRWLALMGRKVLYLFNDWEQYNNLSYPYQKDRLALLRFNPLGWGLLLLAAAAGLALGWSHLDRRAALALGLLGAAYAAGVLLFFVSARFRLPLAPMLCIFAGGLAVGPVSAFAAMRVRKRIAFLVAMAALGGLAYGNWANARDDATFIQDELLLANASARLGLDAEALGYAENALSRDPARQDALRVSVVSRFNLAIGGEPADWGALADRLHRLEAHDAATMAISGVVLWREDEREKATGLWRRARERYGDEAVLASVALQLTVEARQPGNESERVLWALLQGLRPQLPSGHSH